MYSPALHGVMRSQHDQRCVALARDHRRDLAPEVPGCLAPALTTFCLRNPTEYGVGEELEQLTTVPHMPVERCCLDCESIRQGAHGEAVDPFLLHQIERGGDESTSSKRGLASRPGIQAFMRRH